MRVCRVSCLVCTHTGVLSVNLDIAAGAPAACMVPAVQVLVERDVLPDLTKFLDGHNDSTPRSQVRTPPRHAHTHAPSAPSHTKQWLTSAPGNGLFSCA